MVSERLRKYIEFKEISYYAFENSIGASRGSISKAVKEGKSIGSATVENILTFYEDLNPIWLLTDKGTMILENPVTNNTENAGTSLENFTKIEIVNFISDNLEAFKEIKSFQLLLKSLYTADEISSVRREIEDLKKKVSDITQSKQVG